MAFLAQCCGMPRKLLFFVRDLLRYTADLLFKIFFESAFALKLALQINQFSICPAIFFAQALKLKLPFTQGVELFGIEINS